MSDPLSSTLTNTSQEGDIQAMLNMDPRKIREGMVFKNLTTNKLYLCTSGITGYKHQQIVEMRKGNLLWVEIRYDAEKQTYIRGTDTLHHVAKKEYPDNVIEDELDLFVSIVEKLNLADNDQKLKYRSLFQSQVVPLEIFEDLAGGKLNEEWKKANPISNWIQPMLDNFFESFFFKWLDI